MARHSRLSHRRPRWPGANLRGLRGDAPRLSILPLTAIAPSARRSAKEAWLGARRREVLPVPYFHLVFTLPHDLNGLIGQCPRALYEMLFGAVSATLTEFALNPRWLGGTAAFSLVLHTWKQDLGRSAQRRTSA